MKITTSGVAFLTFILVVYPLLVLFSLSDPIFELPVEMKFVLNEALSLECQLDGLYSLEIKVPIRYSFPISLMRYIYLRKGIIWPLY